MTDISIRPATPADLPAITAIYADAVRGGTSSFEIDPPDQAEMGRRMQDLLRDGYPYLVAVRGGALTAYAYAGPYRLRPAFRFTVEDSIYVAPSARRSGIGRRLLDALIAASEERGYRQMVAVIGDSANIASIELHRHAGFRAAGTFTDAGYKFNRWLDSVMMQRVLGDGANTAPDVSSPPA
jgi:L-amino acid N-acyltransferase YncA